MKDKMKVTRFSVSLPPTLVAEFDQSWKSLGYTNRSKAVHDALRTFITEFKWTHRDEDQVAGAVLLLYHHEKPHLLEEIVDVQHKFRDIIYSTTHIHLEEDKCLEIVAVSGKANRIRKLAQEIMTKKGVKEVKVAVVAP